MTETTTTIQKHIEFTDETKTLSDEVILHRIRATRDLPYQGVKAGDVGGWVESLDNIADEAWVADEAMVFGRARVCNNAWVGGNTWVFAKARVGGHARVDGNAWVYGNARIDGNAQIGNNARVYDNAWVDGDARVSGDAWVYSDARVCGKTLVGGKAQIGQGVRVGGRAQVGGCALVVNNAWVFGNAQVGGNARIDGNAWISETNHVLSVLTHTSRDLSTTLFRTEDGHLIHVEGWTGTVDELARMVADGSWVKTFKADTDEGREELEAFILFARDRMSRW